MRRKIFHLLEFIVVYGVCGGLGMCLNNNKKLMGGMMWELNSWTAICFISIMIIVYTGPLRGASVILHTFGARAMTS